MSLSLLTVTALAGISFTAGFIDSIAGGGGLLTLPSFLIAGLPPHYALGTNKFVSTTGTSVAVFNYIRSGKVSFRIIGAGILFILCGSFIGSKMILHFDQAIAGKIIIFLLPVGVTATLIPKRNGSGRNETGWKRLFLLIPVICFAIGFYDGFFGPGTGAFLALSLHLFLKLDLIEATANAKVFNLLSNIGGLAGFILGGTVLFKVGIPLAAANMLGNWFGSHLAIRKGEGVIRFFLTLVLVILFATLIWKFFIK